ncbi:DUF3084 domain-containing protein, partial [bacterium]|nr:DUF3084 domain-containing protein [bacterium]
MTGDGVGILPLLTLLLAGGVISYLGDIAGRRFARSRRRLFGLRPKHASALWAGIVGVVVATFVFALLVAVSEDFRTAVFQINLIRQERQDALAETELVNRRLGIIQERFSSLEQELAAATAKLAESRAEVASLESARDVLSLQIAGLEAQVADLFGQITALEGERDGLRDDLAARTLQVTELTLREAGLLGSVDDLEGRLVKLEEEVAETTARNLELNRENLLVLAS